MGAFNRIGCTWAGAHRGLQKDVVRTEWGSTAILDTDIAINTTMQSVVGGLEGGNTMWGTSGSVFYGYMAVSYTHLSFWALLTFCCSSQPRSSSRRTSSRFPMWNAGNLAS